ncbi:MAG: ornithine cyclodeaminase family protein [Chloroflexi bacterium]|nr:ornithine cyclodeaminase family protein [Chloroflexota bacterium]
MAKITYVTYPGNPKAEEEIKSRSVLFIDNEVAQQVLTMEDCLDVVEDAYREFGLGRATASRAHHEIPPLEGDTWLNWAPMVAALPRLGAVAIRIRSDFFMSRQDRLVKYAVAPGKFCGLILLFSTRDAAPLAIMNEGHIQHMRVAAAGGLSAKYMARQGASTLGLFGTGGMAVAHAWAIATARPLKRIQVFSPNPEHRRAFARQVGQDLGIQVVAVDEPSQAAEGADILAACTSARVPVVLGQWLKPGMHALSVGHEEFDDEVFRRCHRYVYSRAPTTQSYVADPERKPPSWRGGEEYDTRWTRRERRLLPEEKMAFLSDVILGRAAGRASDEEVTVFTSQGIPIQFTATAYKVYEKAREQGLGRKLPLAWFLQDISD